VPFTLRTEVNFKIQAIHKLNTTQKKQASQNSKTKLPWFSCLLRHLAMKRGGLGQLSLLQQFRAHTWSSQWTIWL